MNPIYDILFIITAIIIMVYDYKYQQIPEILVLFNYLMIAIIVNPYLLVGCMVIMLLKKLDQPIDIVYLLTIVYLNIIVDTRYAILCVLTLLLYVILYDKKNNHKISLMVPLELCCILEIIVKEMSL